MPFFSCTVQLLRFTSIKAIKLQKVSNKGVTRGCILMCPYVMHLSDISRFMYTAMTCIRAPILFTTNHFKQNGRENVPPRGTSMHGRRQGGARGCNCTPLEFENDDVIYCLQVKCTKFFARASGASTNCS